MNRNEAHEANMDAAQRALEAREAQGEDMSRAYVDARTYEIKKMTDLVGLGVTEIIYRVRLIYAQLSGKGERDEALLRDMLTDLMHLADEYGIDFARELEIAEAYYEAEVQL